MATILPNILEKNNAIENSVLVTSLLKLIEQKNELENSCDHLNYHIKKTFLSCLIYSTSHMNSKDVKKILEVDSIVDHLEDELNLGHWSKTPLTLRRAYTVGSYMKMITYLKSFDNNCNSKNIQQLLKILDMGLILGAPLEKNSTLLTESAKLLTSYIIKHTTQENKTTCIDSTDKKDKGFQFMFTTLNGRFVNSLVLPSLEHFNNFYFKLQMPLKLCGCMDHWPARTKWLDINYLLDVAGYRTVPIEIGSHYADESWSQKLMTFREFIQKFYLEKSDSIGYLAQHNLFDQITELRNDICVPDYCCLSKDFEKLTDPDINCWLGPSGTVSPMHFDPKNNILAQVFGRKQIILFSPDDSDYLYPHEGILLTNTSQVDPILPNLDKFKNFHKATMYKCLLEPGEMLFIPEKWWHHVVALDKSFSVSFWWQ